MICADTSLSIERLSSLFAPHLVNASGRRVRVTVTDRVRLGVVIARGVNGKLLQPERYRRGRSKRDAIGFEIKAPRPKR